jgi:NAD(P)-dependent dehydrogenase (short-subunit alcohol dehydrogenase family)
VCGFFPAAASCGGASNKIHTRTRSPPHNKTKNKTEEKQARVLKESTLLGRAGQPAEVGPSFVFLASADALFFTGQTLHPDGGKFIGG